MPGGNIITIRVVKQGDDAVLQRLKEIDELATKLGKHEIKININTSNVDKLKEATKNAEESTKQLKNQITELSTATNQSVGDMTQAFAGLDSVLTSLENRVARTLVNKLRGATKDAINMMKDVDDQLVVVRKVSGATAEEVAAMGERAYQTATKYGVAASDYLSSVASFVRAGYREQAEGLAELSVKTQLVGDVTEDVADQFLLSTDKAYQFGGSVEKLNQILDSANELDNKYATSISKIASGMGIVAPVAAQMNVSVEELMASIGTITAVTQRTGTEAARALRAIFLNIVGDTKTEIDEGVTWTTGEIAGLRDVLKKYVPELVAEADIQGTIIDPMRAIEGLSNAMKEGLLSEQELMQMVSDIGGKLRSSQLLALIQNWDMYKSMMEDIGASTGSADREVQNALDSWTRKTEILRNTWTSFLTNFINSDTFKGIIDRLVELVKWLDENQWAVKQLIDAFLVIEGMHLFTRMVNGAQQLYGSLQNIYALVMNLIGAIESFGIGDILSALGGSAAGGVLGIMGIYAALVGGSMGIKEWNDEQEREKTNELVEKVEEYKGAIDTAIESKHAFDDTYDSTENIVTDIGNIEQAYYDLATALGYTRLEALQYYSEYDSYKAAADALTQAELIRATIGSKESVKAAKEQLNSEYKKTRGGVSQVAQVAEMQGLSTGMSDKMQTYVQSTIDTYGEIETLEELIGYYNRLNLLKSEFEAEGATKSDPYYWAVLNDLEDITPMVEDYNALLEDEEAITEALAAANEALADSTGGPILSLNTLTESLANATTALQEYQAELGMDEKGNFEEKGTTLSEYKGIYDTAMEHYNAGEYGSNQYQAAMRLLLPDSVLQEIEYDYEKAGEIASSKYFEALMKSADDGGAEFANQLYDLWQTNAEGLEGIMEITENDDGSFGIWIDDFDRLGEILEIDGGALAAWSDQIDIFNKGLNWSDKDLDDFIEKAGALKTLSDGVTQQIDLDKFFSAIVEGGKEAGKSSQELESDIYNVAEYLKGLEDFTFTGTIGQIDEAKNKALDLAASASEAEEKVGDMGEEEATPTLDLDNNLFLTKIQISKQALTDLGNTTVSPKVALSGAIPQHLAEGTDYAQAGNALTGEEGPELVLEGNSARIVGLGGPEVTTLEQGAKVYTAEETEEILSRKSSRRIPAFWSGGHFTRTTSAGGATKVAKRSGASSSGSKSSAGTKKSSSEKDEELERRKAVVELLETELDLLEAQNKPVKDQVAKVKEIQNALLDQINYMKSIGAEQADINKLYVEWYKWEDQIAKLQKQIFDDLDDAIDNELKDIKAAYDEQTDAIDAQIDALKEARDVQADQLELEEKQLAVEEARAKLQNAQNERTVRMYNASTGQWEWVANAKNVQSAQEALQNAEDALAKYLEDMEYQAQVDALEAQKQALKDEYEDIKSQWQEILDALEDPAKELGEVLADIARNATADQKEDIEILNGMLAKFGYAVPGYGAKYDDGGLLFGLGGIKATASPEGVLNPALTAALLSPQANEVFAQRMSELGYLYGASKTMPSSLLAGGNRIGSQTNQYGNVYTMNGVTIGEDRAKSMTVYELAQLSRNLSAYNRVN